MAATENTRSTRQTRPTMKFIPDPAPRTLSELLAFVSLSSVSSISTNAPRRDEEEEDDPSCLDAEAEAPRHYAVRCLVYDDGHDYRNPSVHYRYVGVDSGEQQVRERTLWCCT